MPQKRYLLTPGPTPVPPEVLAAIAEPVIHHRSPDFKTVFQQANARLQDVFRTENDVLMFTSSGTGAYESAFVNLLSPGEKALVVSHGEFGSRWQKLGAAVGAEVVALTYDWGQAPRAGGRLASARRERGGGRVHRPLRDVDRRRVRYPLARRRVQQRGCDLRRGCDLEPRRGAARDGCLGDRRRRDGIAEGADDASRASPSHRSRSAPGRRRPTRRCPASTGTGRRRGRPRRRAARRSRPRRRSSSRSTRRSS